MLSIQINTLVQIGNESFHLHVEVFKLMQWYKLVQARINKTGFGHLHINQRLVSFDQVE